MYSLSRISLINWYLIDAKDIEIRGEAALIGPTGAGKSSIQDAIQSVITGVNQNRLNLNASASGRSSRSVLEYCLGMTGDPAEDGKPLRSSCETILALTFRNYYTEEPITVGVALSARHGDSREDVLSRFVIPGHAFSVAHVRRRVKGVSTIAPWSEIAASLRAEHPGMEEFRNSAEKFTAHMLTLMRNGATPPNPSTSCAPFPMRWPSNRSLIQRSSCAISYWSPSRWMWSGAHFHRDMARAGAADRRCRGAPQARAAHCRSLPPLGRGAPVGRPAALARQRLRDTPSGP